MGCGSSSGKTVDEPSKERKAEAKPAGAAKKATPDWVGGEGLGPARNADGKINLDAARMYASAGKPASKSYDPSMDYGPSGNIGAFAEEIPLPEHYKPQKMVMHDRMWLEERTAKLHSSYRTLDITNEVARQKKKKEGRKWCPFCRRLYPDFCICDDGEGGEQRQRSKSGRSKSGSKRSTYSPPATWRSDVEDDSRGPKLTRSYTEGTGGALLRGEMETKRRDPREGVGAKGGMLNWRTMTSESIERWNMGTPAEERGGLSPRATALPGRRQVAGVTSEGVRAGEWLQDPDSDPD